VVGIALALAAAPEPPPAFGFLAPASGVWQVWASRDGGEPRPITSSAEDVVHLSSAPGRGELLAVTRGGAALILSEDGEVVGRIDLGRDVDEAALAPDGSRIAYTLEAGPGRDRDIWTIGRDGAGRRPAVRREGMQHAPAWSPDGAALAFTSSGEAGGEDLWWLRLDGTEEAQVTTGPHVHLEPSVAPDGGIFVSSNRDGGYDIWRLDAAGGAPRRVIAAAGLDAQPRVSADGGRILFVSRRAGRSAVWVARADGSGARPLTDGSTEVRHPVWTGAGAGAPGRAPERAGGWIAFLRLTGGRWQPWRARPDGSGLEPMAEIPVDAARVTVAASGRRALVNGADGTLYLLEGAGGPPRRVEVDPPGPTDAALSPDGALIAYSVNTLGGIDSNDLWVVAAEGGRARKITDQAHLQHFPSWTAGREILYLSGSGGQTHDIWRVAASGGKPSLVLGGNLYNFDPAASPAGDVAFSSNRSGDYEIWLLDAGSGEPRRLTDDPAYDGQPSFSPDGRRLAFVSRRGGSGRIWTLDASTGAAAPVPVEGDVRMPFWFGGGADGGGGR
jgi:Tol biopolymer transport system component